jgi:hypothetical protein
MPLSHPHMIILPFVIAAAGLSVLSTLLFLPLSRSTVAVQARCQQNGCAARRCGWPRRSPRCMLLLAGLWSTRTTSTTTSRASWWAPSTTPACAGTTMSSAVRSSGAAGRQGLLAWSDPCVARDTVVVFMALSCGRMGCHGLLLASPMGSCAQGAVRAGCSASLLHYCQPSAPAVWSCSDLEVPPPHHNPKPTTCTCSALLPLSRLAGLPACSRGPVQPEGEVADPPGSTGGGAGGRAHAGCSTPPGPAAWHTRGAGGRR